MAVPLITFFGLPSNTRALDSDLQVVLFDAGPAVPGGEVQFSGALICHGPDTAENAILEVILPDQLAFVSGASFSGAVAAEDPGDPQVVTYSFGNVGAFSSDSLTLVVEVVDDAEPGTYSVTATASSDSTDPVPGNSMDSAEVVVNALPDDFFNPGMQTSGGDPVGTYAGNYIEFETPDLNLGGPLAVFLERYYDSAMFTDGVVQSALGNNWQHNWDIKLSVMDASAIVAFRRGRILRFENDGAGWNQVFNTQIGFRLVDLGAEFMLADPRSQLMYFFDGDGLLIRLEDGRGNTITLSYVGGLLASVTDGLGRTLTFTYGAGGLLESVTDGARTVQYGHTGSNLTSFTDADGKITNYAYDPANLINPGLMTARTLPEGNAPFVQVYGADGRVQSQSDALGGAMGFAYANNGGSRSTTTTDALGNTMVHNYRPTGDLAELIDEAGERIRVFSDPAGRRGQVIDRKGRATRLTYDSVSGLPTRIDHPAHNDDQMLYVTRAVNGIDLFDLERIVRPDGTIDRFTYDALGNLISHTDRDGQVWSFVPNARGQVLTSTNPAGGVSTFTYDASARLASATDTDVGVSTFGYDGLHRLTGVTNPDTTSLAFIYDPLNRLTSATDERGNATEFAYDANSRLTSTTDALNQETHFEYDALDRLVRAEDRLGNAATYTYDPRSMAGSLLTSVTDRNGFVTQLEYDGRRRLTSVVDPGNKASTFEYDSEGLLVAVSNPLGETGRIVRDAMGYPVTFIDSQGNELNLLLDGMKRVTRTTDPLGRIANYSYDPRGMLKSASREPDVEARYTYDALGNLTQILDPNNRIWGFTYTPMGRAASMTDPIGRATAYTYDNRGRLEIATFPDAASRTTTYDPAGNITRLLYSDGTDLNFQYDALDRLTQATGSDPIAFEYDAMDRVVNTRQAGLDFGAAYDAGGRLTSVSYPNPAGGQWTITYTYDSRGRVTGVSDDLTGTTLTLTYDDAHRLTGLTRPNGVNGAYTYDSRGLITRIAEGTVLDLRYAYDAAGQVIEADFVTAPIDPSAAAAESTSSFFYDSASQISSTPGYAHNQRGSQTQADGAVIGWDDALRLRSVDDVAYEYDALGNLQTRTEGGTTIRYFYNAALGRNPIVAERDDTAGDFSRFYVWSPGGFLLYIVNLPGNTVSFPHFDRVGSTLALTDEAGTVSDAYAYNAFGKLLSRSGTNLQPFLFNGKYGVRADGPLYHMRARWYDPVPARFLSKEPIWPMLANPKLINPYQFALNDPLFYVDPEGTQATFEQPTVPGAGLSAEARTFLRGMAMVFEDIMETDRDVDNGQPPGNTGRSEDSPFFNGSTGRHGLTGYQASRQREYEAFVKSRQEQKAASALIQDAGSGLRFERWTGRPLWPKPRNPVTSGTLSAEFGGSVGGVVNVVTKWSGAELSGGWWGDLNEDPLQFEYPSPGILGGGGTSPAKSLVESSLSIQLADLAAGFGSNFLLHSGENTPLAGDYNGDGVVDANDYAVWRDNLHGPRSALGLSGEGTVGPAEYDVWRANFGATR